jgi:hypothetical protein
MMNGAALSMSAKRHTITAGSTMHDEAIEYSIASNRVVAFRNMSNEMGFHSPRESNKDLPGQ